jgi:branched-chain amino acid transport system permease protein
MSDYQFLLQLLFTGVCVGSIYSLIAHGFNITFWTMKVVNFAHGPFIMFCSMIILSFFMFGLPLIISILLGMIIIAVLGLFLEKISVRPLVRYPTSMGWIVSTLGAGVFLQALATKIWGAQALAFPGIIFESTDYVPFFGIQLSSQYLLVLGTALGIMIFMEFIVNKTIWGKAMKAVAHDSDLSRVMGIKSKAIVSLSFIISALLAGVAGLLIAPIYGTIDPAFGMNLMVLGFVAAVLGGMGSSKGALLGGILLGVIEKMVGGYISTSAEHGVAFAILIFILAVKPEGLLGLREVKKV